MTRDEFGKSLHPIGTKKLFLLDLDGTMYLDSQLVPGAIEFLSLVKEKGLRAIFITNNSSKSVEDYVAKLNRLGITATKADFFTSSMGMAITLNQRYPGKKVYLMGTKSLRAELASSHVHLAKDRHDHVDVVALGYDTELTYSKLEDICWLLQNDLPYLATNPDYVCPVEFGYVPDCGAIAEMLRHATGKMPQYIGKPDPMIIHLAIEQAGMKPEETVVIGDRLYTDIQSGINAQVTTICVLSGEATIDDVRSGSVTPDYTVSSIKAVWEALSTQK
jgi:HAD superfamily hydrolase (TIGR01450 family)